MRDKPAGWHWFDDVAGAAPKGDANITEQRELAVAAAHCLSGPEGTRVMTHLKQMTRERHLSADCSNRVLRHLEGQRFLVTYLETLVQRGLRPN